MDSPRTSDSYGSGLSNVTANEAQASKNQRC